MSKYTYPPSHRFSGLLVLVAVFATGGVAFAAGVFMDRAGWLPGRSDRQPARLGKTFGPFWEAWDKVHTHYVDRQAVDDEKMTQGAIQGMLHSLGDHGHTTYISRKMREEHKEGLTGEFQGIGTAVSLRNGRPVIERTMPKSPAQSAGLKSGDVVLAIDDQEAKGLTQDDLSRKLRGAAGSEVKLSVRRQGEAKPIVITVKRAKIDIPSVSWTMLPGNFAHLHLQHFSKKTTNQLRSALDEINKQKARGLILDLRGNTGGLKEQAINVASEFLNKGQVIFIQQDARGHRTKMNAHEGGKATTIPLAVLINRQTASSAEILAGAIQDHKRGAVIGVRTFGTGTVLREYGLSDGSAVLLAIYQWLTPNGRKIWHQGISPDPKLEVPLSPGARVLWPTPERTLTEADLVQSTDKQLLKAIEVLREKYP
jgi:carboxyl-terminal processing protease